MGKKSLLTDEQKSTLLKEIAKHPENIRRTCAKYAQLWGFETQQLQNVYYWATKNPKKSDLVFLTISQKSALKNRKIVRESYASRNLKKTPTYGVWKKIKEIYKIIFN